MSEEWIERQALVIVKAYPNPSAKYFETVCVAAITAEEGWVRLYPVNFRSLPADKRFKKYQRVRLRMKKHEHDNRPESYRPDEDSIQLQDTVESHGDWRDRWRWIRPTLGPSMCELIRQQKVLGTSLGFIKPRAVTKLHVEEVDLEWSDRKKAIMDQLPLFDPVDTKLEKMPFVFRYEYLCEDFNCRGHRQSIIDWELMELYRNVRNPHLSHDENVGKDSREVFRRDVWRGEGYALHCGQSLAVSRELHGTRCLLAP